MTDYKLKIENITKKFGRRLVFSDINAEFQSGEIVGLKGENGSGKSTLSKIILGIDSPNSGKIVHSKDSQIIGKDKLHDFIGFSAPYLNLYSEFTALENLQIFAKIRGVIFDKEYSDSLFERFNLAKRQNDLLKGYSSGMLQRMKIIFSVFHKPKLLLMDEPVSNLDNNGKSQVYDIIRELSSETLIIIASNEDSDLALCNKYLEIENYKS